MLYCKDSITPAEGAIRQFSNARLNSGNPPRTNAPTGRVDRNWTKSGEKAP